jgi:ubiquinone biosynthesis protein COQ4
MSAATSTASPTAPAPDAPLAIAPAPPRRRVQWRRARAALDRLIEDPERTEQVFELIDALAGNSGERLFQRFLRHPDGPRLLREKPALLQALRDLPGLEALPEGSFGRAYAAFMREGELRADGLMEASDQVERESREQIDPDRDWFYARLRDMHDLWHVLTGYGRDVAGETANLAFTWSQTRNRGVGVIVLAAVVLGPKTRDLHWPRYLWRARRRGRRAALLCAARYEELLALPLAEARRRLGIDPPAVAHPEGILVADHDELVAVAR